MLQSPGQKPIDKKKDTNVNINKLPAKSQQVSPISKPFKSELTNASTPIPNDLIAKTQNKVLEAARRISLKSGDTSKEYTSTFSLSQLPKIQKKKSIKYEIDDTLDKSSDGLKQKVSFGQLENPVSSISMRFNSKSRES